MLWIRALEALDRGGDQLVRDGVLARLGRIIAGQSVAQAQSAPSRCQADSPPVVGLETTQEPTALSRTRLVETKLTDWIGQRSQAGRLPPQGFPKANRFT